jgi:hypothetical protein
MTTMIPMMPKMVQRRLFMCVHLFMGFMGTCSDIGSDTLACPIGDGRARRFTPGPTPERWSRTCGDAQGVRIRRPDARRGLGR